MLGLAGLAFAACSSDDEVSSAGLDGDAVVRVNIVTAGSTRAVDTPVAGEDLSEQAVVVNKLTLTLTAEKGGKSITIDKPNEKGETVLEQAQGVMFEAVRNPSKLEVFINDGKAAPLTLEEVVETGLAAPMYAVKTGAEFGQAVKEEYKGKKVMTYKVTLNPQHETALVEFSGIKHKDHQGKPCAFKSIRLDGIFMDNIQTAEGGSRATYDSWNAAQNGVPTFEVINEDFMTPDKVWPAAVEQQAKCYAYNMFPGTCASLVLAASNITANDGFDALLTNGYARVARYKLDVTKMTPEQKQALGANDEGYITEFKAGYVYRIKDIVVPEEAWGPTPAGGEDVNVLVVEVTVNPWKLVSGTVEWN